MGSELVLKIKNPFTTPVETAFQPATDDFVTIGRGEGNEVIIVSPFVSRQHLTIERSNDIWKIRDLNSRNGSRFNKKDLKGSIDAELGSVIEIGDVVITLLKSDDDVAKKLLEKSPLTEAVVPDTGIDSHDQVQSFLEQQNKSTHSFGLGGGVSRNLSDSRTYKIRRKRRRIMRLAIVVASLFFFALALYKVIYSF